MRTALMALLAMPAALLLAGPASAQAPAYDSAFSDYKPYREPTLRLTGRAKVEPPAKTADPHAGHAMHGMHGPGMHTPAPAAEPPKPKDHDHHLHHH